MYGGLCVVVVGLLLGLGSYAWYSANTAAVNEANQEAKSFSITAGESSSQVADRLESDGLIRNQLAFRIYLKIHNKQGAIQAGDYQIAQSMSVSQIVSEFSTGRIESRNFTILPGKRLDQLKKSFLEAGFDEADIDKALDAANYKTHPITKYKPADASLEGYIYPETFRITDNSTATQVITKSLDELYRKLTPDLVSQLEAQGLNVHDAIILASIVEKEVSRPADRPLVAQVFLKRLREGIMLGSDVTFIYASVVFGGRAAPDLDNPYNTRLYAGLPPGPVSNFDISSLEAVANPSNTEYLFFVSGDDGTTHFSYTFEEHNRNIALYCKTNCLLPDQRDDIRDL